MIYTNVTVRINNNGTATSSNKVVLYRGDREVEIQMTLAGNPFVVESSAYAQLIIRRNNAAPIITGIAPLRDSKVILTITEANIDELTEVGSYAYQIRLYDDDMSARVTLPPVENGLEVREPIVDEASGVIGRAMVGYSLISRAFALDDDATFNEYDEYNRTNWVDGDFITDVKMNKIEDALYTINQRVLSNAVSAYVSSNTSPDQKVGIGESLDITFEFTSPNLGRGTVKVLVDGVQKISMYVDQEVETTVTVTEDMLKKGENKVTLHVVDRAGKMSNELLFTVRYGSTEITSDFDAYTAYQYGASVRYYFIPTSLDSSMALTFYMRIDGVVSEGMPCTSDVRGYFTFPNNLAIGDHFCEAYIVDAEGNQSNVLTFTFVVIDGFSIVVASDTRNPVIEEGAQLSLDYRVYMQYGDTFITKTYVDGNLVNTGQCGLETVYYRTSSLTEGTHTIKVEVFDTSETVSDYIIWTVTVTESTFEALTPASSGGIFLASALNHSNSDATKNVWIGVDQDGNEIEAPLQGFAFNNESGWIDDELVFNGNSSVIVPIAPLANNARYGFTLDIEFTSRAVGEEDAMVLNLWDDTKNCGIRITTEQLILRSAEGNECMLYFEDNANTSVMFIIDRNEAKAKIYLNGVMCSAFHLSDYEAGGQYFLEDFSVSGNLQLGGKGYCKIRNLRVYEVALTTTEILNNFISNKIDKNEQKDLIKFQNGDDLPTLTVYCDFSGLGKDDKKPCKIVYTSTDEEKYGKSFTLDHKQSQLQYQGTSSMAYPIKNYRLNLRDENGNKLYYDFPFGKPECRFTLKADFMSSGHWQNTGLTKWINDNLYHYNENDESSMNPKKWFDLQNGGSLDDTRECIYGFPCRLILVNDGNTPLNEGQNEPTPGNTKDMGIFNFNNDKDNTDTMGFDQDNFPNCMGFEVTANSDTSAGAFMSFNGDSQEDELEYLQQSFEMRYPDPDDYDEWHGYLGINAGTMVTDYIPVENGYSTTYWYWDQTNMTISSSTVVKTVECYYNDNLLAAIAFNKDYGSVTLIDGSNKLRLIFEDVPEEFYIGDTKYIFGNEIAELIEQDPYLGEEISPDYGLKRVIDWVDNCSDAEFVKYFDKYFHRDYTLRYYLLVITLGMVDNLGKNMMLDSWDGQIWMPRFYDCDTICSYDNSGDIKFDVDIEMEQGYWNTSSSRLWTRIRDLMHDELVIKYNDMRQNGLSYESLMSYFYDDQIAKIPQKYYNQDYDVKYAPFANSYMGMAHGDGYEHLKRWLKKRLIFTDTLFDYAPSYNNDVLTIRANTTQPMTITIETYTPVYQHVSWYNGQMDKQKIDGKIAVSFTGTAMAATDQEVLIYGGSNIKRISGLSSMNPNQMLIGSATRLVELDAPNCPLLADINSNKANLSPHTYLNKVNLSNCPLLGGNLLINNSPLIKDINIKGTAITGVILPSSIRNLQILRLPNSIPTLVLHDAAMLHTLEFDPGVNLQSVSMTNCNALTNVVNLDLLNTPSVSLNNSYNTAAELYFRDTTNLSLSNMSNLERVIFTPNNEYETFELINVANAPDYKVITFNCPKLSTFMTTAPYRESYNNGDYGDIQPNTTFTANSIDISSTQFTDVKLLCTTDTNTLKLPTTVKNFYCDSSFDLDTDYLEDGEYDVVHGELVEPYTTDYEGEVNRLDPITEDIPLIAGNFNNIVSDISWGDHYSDKLYVKGEYSITDTGGIQWLKIFGFDDADTVIWTYGGGSTTDNTGFNGIVSDDISYIRISCITVLTALTMTYNKSYTPNLIPSSADGSLIFSMYAPSNAVAPASGTWDLYGLEFDNFHTFGMNNDVKPSDDSCIKCYTDKIIAYHAYFWGSNSGSSVTTSQKDLLMIFDKLELFGEETTFAITASDNKAVQGGHFNSGWGSGYSGTSGATTFTWSTNADTPYLVARVAVADEVEWIQINDVRILLSNLDIREVATTAPIVEGLLEVNALSKYNMILGNSPTSITMPARYDDYNITIKNADISPKTHNTMLYPLLVNEDNPITGTLDYTNYTGKHLSWSFAYTDEEYVNIIQPKDELLNSYEYRYNAFYDTEYEFDNPYEIARYTSSVSGVLPTFNSEFTYTYDEIDNGDGTYTTKIYADDLDILPTSISFKGISALLSVEKIKVTSNVSNMANMFYECSNLTSLNVSGFDTSNVINMSCVFYGCHSLTTLDTSNWDTSNATGMSGMFYECRGLTSLDVSGFNTSSVTDMNNMFYGCSGLTSLDVSGFDTSKVTDTSYMFYNCNNLTSLDVSGFGTSKVTSMSSMFYGCGGLTSLDVSGFDTSKVTDMNNMFYGCSGLISLNIEMWPLNDITQTAISSLPVGDDAKNEIYTSANFTVPTGWTLIYSNPYDIAIYTCNASGVLPAFNTEYTGYSTEETDNGDGTYTTYIRTNDLDVMPSKYDFNYKTALLSVEKLKVTSNVTNMGRMFYGCSKLTSIEGIETWITSNVTDMSYMFYSCSGLTSLDVSGFDTSKVTSMSRMFSGCTNLTSLNVSGFNTSNVTNIGRMFYECRGLTSLDVSGFNTRSVKDMQGAFYGCSGLTSLDVSGFDTSNVTDMSYMFYSCSGLTSLDVSGFGTSKVTSMSSMFQNCNNLTSLDVSSFDTSNVIYMNGVFCYCNNLTSLDLSGWDTSKVTVTSSMFSGCTNLTRLNVLGFNTSNNTNMNGMFQNCRGLTTLNVSGWDTSKVYNMMSIFNGCNNLTSLDLSSWDTSNVEHMQSMFDNCSSLTSLDITMWPLNDITQTAISSLPVGDDAKNEIQASSNFTVPTGWTLIYSNPYDIAIYTCNASGVLPAFNTEYTGYSTEETDNGDGTYTTYIRTNDLDVMPTRYSFSGKTALLSVEKLKVTSNVTTMTNMFYDCGNLTSLEGIETWNTSNVTDMSYMFYSCKKLTSLEGIENWNTSNVTNMYITFYNCSNLTSLDLSGWDTSKVTNMGSMFKNCTGLTNLNVSNFDVSKISSMKEMFYNCNNLTSLEGIENWNTSNVTNMTYMFAYCFNLTSLDLSVFVTSNVIYMNGVFCYCTGLTSLNVSGWDTSNVTDMTSMFTGCSNLTSLDSMTNISVGLALSNTNLDTSSLLDVIDNLATVTATKTLKLGTTLLAKLTEEQIAVATNKGWTVS